MAARTLLLLLFQFSRGEERAWLQAPAVPSAGKTPARQLTYQEGYANGYTPEGYSNGYPPQGGAAYPPQGYNDNDHYIYPGQTPYTGYDQPAGYNQYGNPDGYPPGAYPPGNYPQGGYPPPDGYRPGDYNRPVGPTVGEVQAENVLEGDKRRRKSSSSGSGSSGVGGSSASLASFGLAAGSSGSYEMSNSLRGSAHTRSSEWSSSDSRSGSGWLWPWDYPGLPWQRPHWKWWQYIMTAFTAVCCCCLIFVCAVLPCTVFCHKSSANNNQRKQRKRRKDSSSSSSSSSDEDQHLVSHSQAGSVHAPYYPHGGAGSITSPQYPQAVRH